MKQVPPQSEIPEAMQMKPRVPGRQGGRGMPRGMRSPLRPSSFPTTGKYEKASTVVHSGLRKEMKFVGQVGGDVEIPMRRRQETPVSGCPRGKDSLTQSQQSWSQLISATEMDCLLPAPLI